MTSGTRGCRSFEHTAGVAPVAAHRRVGTVELEASAEVVKGLLRVRRRERVEESKKRQQYRDNHDLPVLRVDYVFRGSHWIDLTSLNVSGE